MVELVEWQFEMSGFRVDGLNGQGEVHSGKSEKHLDDPQSSASEPP